MESGRNHTPNYVPKDWITKFKAETFAKCRRSAISSRPRSAITSVAALEQRLAALRAERQKLGLEY
jgi:uncharacterized small protein (DUF1192 family)